MHNASQALANKNFHPNENFFAHSAHQIALSGNDIHLHDHATEYKEADCSQSLIYTGDNHNEDPDELAYRQYLMQILQSGSNARPLSRKEFDQSSHKTSFMSQLKGIAKKVVQTCRLMVGVHDYECYLQHMKMHHSNLEPLSREAFYRYCLDARFGANGKLNKCPC